MASKKKLRKRLKYYERKMNSYLDEIIGQRETIKSLQDDIRVLIKGEAHGRIMSIKRRIEMEDSLEKIVWDGAPIYHPPVSDNLARTYYGDGFFRQIVDSASEYEEMNQVDTDRSEFFSKEFVETVGLFEPGEMTAKEFADLILLKPIPGSEADRGVKYPELSDMKGRRSGMKPGAPQIWKGGAEYMHRHVDDMQLGKKNNVLKAWLDSKPKKK